VHDEFLQVIKEQRNSLPLQIGSQTNAAVAVESETTTFKRWKLNEVVHNRQE